MEYSMLPDRLVIVSELDSQETAWMSKKKYSHPLIFPHFVVLEPEFKMDYV